MMLIAASWPSKSDAAVTTRTRCGARCSGVTWAAARHRVLLRARGARSDLGFHALGDVVAVLLDLVAQPAELADPARRARARRCASSSSRRASIARVEPPMAWTAFSSRDLREREAERLQALDEAQPLELVLAVDAAPARLAAHPGEQSELLVVADGARRDAEALAHLGDRELGRLGLGHARLRQLT